MASMTYSDLYTLVNNEIQKNVGIGGGSVKNSSGMNRNNVVGGRLGSSSANAIVDTSAIMNSIMDLMLHTIPPQIKSGLNVKATSPPTSKITVSAGEGTVGGRIFNLITDTEFTLPLAFDTTTAIWYINLGPDGVNISKTPIFGYLIVAKVIVPKPGVSKFIGDNRDLNKHPWDAWIVNFREYKLFGNEAGKFEEDTVDLLRDNIGDLLADNLIGNIRLSEDLKITNTQGSLELDSKAINLYDPNSTKIASFNRQGTFFYDSNGIEIAKFSVDGAKIGNINILKDRIETGNFASGPLGTGFQIKDNGAAEFNDILLRGKLKASIFEYDSVSAVAGNIVVTHDADILDADMTTVDTVLKTSGDVTFETGDILEIKTSSANIEYFEVSVVTNSSTYTVVRDKGSTGAISWTKGTAIVNLGQSEAGGIFITASEANAPYLSVFTHDGSPWTGLDTKLRLENLNGFLGYASDTYGIGIGTSSTYLKYDPVNGLRIKGDITITGGDAAVTFVQEDEPGSSGDPGEPKAGDIWYVPSTGFSYVYVEGSGASFTWETMSSSGITDSDGKINQAATPAGAGLYLGSSYMGYYSGAAWTSYIKSDGSFQFTGDASNKIVWDGATLAITGVITCGASSSYAGASIATSYTAAKCTDALADQTSVNTSSDTSAVGGLTASKIAGWAHTSDTTKIDGGDIYTNTVTATQINVTQLDAPTVNTGTLNVDEAIKSGQTAYDTGAGFWMEYNSGTPRFSIGNASANKFLWDGTNVSVTGTINATAGAFSGELM